jgi:hypothetical protein
MAMLHQIVDGVGVYLPGSVSGLGRQSATHHQQANNQN